MAETTTTRPKWPDLSGRHPREILRWAAETYGLRLMTTTAFGYSGMALLHMMAEIAPKTPVYFINTGFHFRQTLEFLDFCREQLGLNIINLKPEQPREQFLAEHGADIMKQKPNFCCAHNKVAPLIRLIESNRYDAWIAALRRDQASTRAQIQIIEPQGSGLVKIHPLAEWTKADVWRYIRENDVPTHPLHDEGYMSIGCEPCTRPVATGEDEREGRWSGSSKTECGLHLGESIKPTPPS
jgi:phosphoadenosine phosphosulfate reductase